MNDRGLPAVDWTMRVRYYECDMQGVAFNAHYYAWADTGCFEFWREVAGGYETVLGHDVDTVVIASSGTFSSPARFDDVLDATTSVARVGTTSLSLQTSFTRDGQAVSAIDVTYVFVERDVAIPRKRAIPDELRSLLSDRTS